MRKRINKALLAIVLSVLCFACLTACNDSDSVGVTVTYYDGETVLFVDESAQYAVGGYRPSDKEGLRFKAWYTDAQLTVKYNSDMWLGNDVKLYAEWEDIYWRVTFYDYNNDIIPVDGYESQFIKHGEAATAPTPPERTGHDFTGWSEDFQSVKSDLAVHARYTLKQCGIAFFYGGQTLVGEQAHYGDSIGLYLNTAQEKLSQRIPEGFEFDAWFTDSALQNRVELSASDTVSYESHTYYARLKLSVPEFTIDSNLSDDSFVYDSDFSMTLTANLVQTEGVSYSYEWRLKEGTEVLCEDDSIVVRSLPTGSYIYVCTVTASAESFSSVWAQREYAFEVTPAAISGVSAADINERYDGSEHRLTEIFGLELGDKVEYSVDGADYSQTNPAFVNAGSHKVYIRIERENHNELIITALVNISKADITVAAKDKEVRYGDALPELGNADYELTGLIAGDGADAVYGQAKYEFGVSNTSVIGESEIKITGGLYSDNYEIEYVSGTLRVSKGKLTVKALDNRVVYGGIIPSDLKADYSGFVFGDGVSSLGGALSFESEYTPSSPVNDDGYKVTPAGLKSKNYEIEYVSGTLYVDKAPLKAKASDFYVIYGGAAPDYTVEFFGFVNDEDKSALDLSQLSFSSEYSAGNPVREGGYFIKAEGIEADNYRIEYEDGTVFVAPKTIFVNVENAETVYGSEAPKFTVFIEDGQLVGQDTASDLGTPVFECEYRAGSSPAGNYEIAVSGLGNANYSISASAGKLVVAPKRINVQVQGAQITYGDASPSSYGLISDGFVGNDTEIKDVRFDTPYSQGANVGSYLVKASGGSNPNYILSYTDGELTVVRKNAVVRVNDASVIYGDNMPQFSFTHNGLYGNDTVAALGAYSYICLYKQGDIAGEYDVFAAFDDEDTNYSVNVEAGVLRVGRRTLSLVYNKAVAFDAPTVFSISDFDGVVSGLYKNDSLQGVLSTLNGGFGDYVAIGGEDTLEGKFVWENRRIINASASDVTDSYQFDYQIRISVLENQYDYNSEDFEGNYDGGMHSISVDAPGLESAVITYSVDGENYSEKKPYFTNSGTYKVYYKITDAQGVYSEISGYNTVKINKKELSVRTADAAVVYGDAAPGYEVAEIEGFANGENDSVLDLSGLSFDCDYIEGSPVKDGGYAVTAYGISARNYSFKYISGKLSVSPKAITVSIDGGQISYGDDAPKSYSLISDGFVGGDNLISGAVFGTDYTLGMGAGEYKVWATGGKNPNYIITISDGTLKVMPKQIVVEAADKTVTYGDAAPEFDYISDGFVGSDNQLNGVRFECGYSRFDDAGNYTISVSGGENPNYAVTFAPGTLKVEKKTLTATARDESAVYGDTKPSFSAVFEGFAGDDDESVLTVGCSFETEYGKGSDVGQYSIRPYGAEARNYDFVYENGTLTVSPLSVEVQWKGLEATYDGTNQGSSVRAEIVSFDQTVILAEVSFEGTAAEFKNAGSYIATASTQNKNFILTNTSAACVMNKGSYQGVAHRVLEGVYSPLQTLEQFALDSWFHWTNKGEVPVCTKTAYDAYYNADPSNYVNFELTVTLNLQKASVRLENTIFEEIYDGTAKSFNPVAVYNGELLDAALYSVTFADASSRTAAGTYKIRVDIVSDNYAMPTADCYLKIKGVYWNDTAYTVEDALKAADSGTIIVKTDTSFADADNNGCYSGAEYYTVKSGVQLLVPYDEAATADTNVTSDTATSIGKVFRLLSIPSGIDITVEGSLNVNGFRSHTNTMYMGHTAGNYGQLDIAAGSVITLKSGAVLHSNGYVTGQGSVVAQSGSTVYDVLAMKDFRGGTVTSLTVGAMFPVNQYTFNNVEVKLIINCGAKMICRYFLYMSSSGFTGELVVVGEGGIFDMDAANPDSRVEKFYNPTTGRSQIDMYGNAYTNSVSLKLGGISLNTGKVEFPLTGNLDISVKSGANFEIRNKFKLLPGASLTVENDASINVVENGMLLIYGGEATDLQYAANWSYSTYGSSQASGQYRIKYAQQYYYTHQSEARIIVSGTLNVNSGTVGGIIRAGEGGVLTLNGATLTTKIKENEGNVKFSMQLKTVTFTAKSYVDGNTTAPVNLTAGKTYIADGSGTWVMQT